MTIERSLVRKLAKEITITRFTQYMHLLKKKNIFIKIINCTYYFKTCFLKFINDFPEKLAFVILICFYVSYLTINIYFYEMKVWFQETIK